MRTRVDFARARMPVRRKLAVVVLVVAGALGSFVAAVATDALRLGPLTFVLPPDALGVSVVVTGLADGDPSADYYSVLILVENRVTDPAIQPYEAGVILRLGSGEIFSGWIPAAGDYERTWTLTLPPPEATTRMFPAGQVGTHGSSAFELFDWAVRGERGVRSQPIFASFTSFYVQTTRLPEGAFFVATVTVTLIWYYHSALQAYPVASRTVTRSP